jgi:signal transduction histidine kinase
MSAPDLPRENLIRARGDGTVITDVEKQSVPCLRATVERFVVEAADREREQSVLDQLAVDIIAGLTLEDILNRLYEGFRLFIPYDRIGFALIEKEGEVLHATWVRSDYEEVQLGRGYSAPLSESSLRSVIESGKPRIINDLRSHVRDRPVSESTRLILEEGILSSLTCPLVVGGGPVGFLFFSSREPGAYTDAHPAVFVRIARQISIAIEKARLISEIERQNDDLRRLNGLKNVFLGAVAHDLRSPISAVGLAADTLENHAEGMDAGFRASLLSEIRLHAAHMAELLDDLLDVVQIESGQLELAEEHLPTADMLREACNRHARAAEAKETRLVLGACEDGEMMADPVRLRQILDNLLSNAIKFSPRGSTIQVRATRSSNRWRIEVQDEGPGIRDDERDRLFQNFARLSAQPTGDEKSTGLGLAICKRLVEAHGGQIGVDPAPRTGSIFWLDLPG